MRHKVKGITLIEMIFTMGLIAIMSMMAIPYMQNLIAKQKLSADLLKIKGIIETARNKAITHRYKVKICGLETAIEAVAEQEPRCSSDWSNLNVIMSKSGKDPQILHSLHLNQHYDLIEWSAFQRKPYLELTPNGFTNHQNGTLYICHPNFSNLHRAVVVSKTGRVSIKKNNPAITKKCNS